MPTVLLIDDNEDLLEFLTDDLQEVYETLTACNGKKALDILNEQHVDVIVCDIMMPIMDGMEFCEIVKSNIDFNHIPLIFLTAKNTIESKIKGLNLEADAYIEKPFSPEYLRAQISSLLKNRNKLKEHFINSPITHINSIAHSKSDEIFLEMLNKTIIDNIADTELDVAHLATLMNMSRPTLYRKIKTISNLTPNEMINLTRLKQAALIMKEEGARINEVYAIVGYHSPTHFTRNFQKQFNVSPAEFIKMKQEKDR